MFISQMLIVCKLHVPMSIYLSVLHGLVIGGGICHGAPQFYKTVGCTIQYKTQNQINYNIMNYNRYSIGSMSV